ncbi:MAG: hypothetical protein IIX08_05775, partial [Bacteroidales bacterium]|nr:hypothetical protein [Bacteroidales bacterium]
IPTNCAELSLEDINNIFGKILYEFPIDRININMPRWVDGLESKHPLKQEIYSHIKETFMYTRILKEINNCNNNLINLECIENSFLEEINLGTGMSPCGWLR